MNRRTFITGVGALAVAPAVAWADIAPTPAFDEARRNWFNKQLTGVITEHLPLHPVGNRNLAAYYLNDALKTFFGAHKDRAKLIDISTSFTTMCWITIRYEMKETPWRRETAFVEYSEKGLNIKFFHEKSKKS